MHSHIVIVRHLDTYRGLARDRCLYPDIGGSQSELYIVGKTDDLCHLYSRFGAQLVSGYCRTAADPCHSDLDTELSESLLELACRLSEFPVGGASHSHAALSQK